MSETSTWMEIRAAIKKVEETALTSYRELVAERNQLHNENVTLLVERNYLRDENAALRAERDTWRARACALAGPLP